MAKSFDINEIDYGLLNNIYSAYPLNKELHDKIQLDVDT